MELDILFPTLPNQVQLNPWTLRIKQVERKKIRSVRVLGTQWASRWWVPWVFLLPHISHRDAEGAGNPETSPGTDQKRAPTKAQSHWPNNQDKSSLVNQKTSNENCSMTAEHDKTQDPTPPLLAKDNGKTFSLSRWWWGAQLRPEWCPKHAQEVARSFKTLPLLPHC